jgi:cyanophycinase
MLERASCFFFAGGDQLRIASLIGGTVLDRLLHARYREGLVVAGTSAGAAVMSDVMMIGGEGDDAPRRGMARISPGFGLIRGVIIDQHFDQRGRIGRLLVALAQNPMTLGIGIDEDTAVVIDGSSNCWVLGSQTVTIIDTRGSGHSNVSKQSPNEPLAFTEMALHVLPEGYGFRLDTREPVLPEDLKQLKALDLNKGDCQE